MKEKTDKEFMDNLRSLIKQYMPIKKRIEVLSSGGFLAKWRNRFEIERLERSYHQYETALLYSFMEFVKKLEYKEGTIYDLKKALDQEMSKNAEDINTDRIDTILEKLDELEPLNIEFDVGKGWKELCEKYIEPLENRGLL